MEALTETAVEQAHRLAGIPQAGERETWRCVEAFLTLLQGAQPLTDLVESSSNRGSEGLEPGHRVVSDEVPTTRIVLELADSDVELLAHWLAPSSDGLLASRTLRTGCDIESAGGRAAGAPSPRSARPEAAS